MKNEEEEEEEEIEFILFSLCAFEKSLDLVCNFIIIIFIHAGIKQRIVQKRRKNQRKVETNDYFFETKKSEGEKQRFCSCLV